MEIEVHGILSNQKNQSKPNARPNPYDKSIWCSLEIKQRKIMEVLPKKKFKMVDRHFAGSVKIVDLEE
jgi:hypothetical protein